MTRHEPITTYIAGDPYTFDADSGEWLEAHHGHDEAAAVRAYVGERMAWRRSA
jgi:hypothetical protein